MGTFCKLLMFLKQVLYLLFGERSKIFIGYGHFYGTLQSLLPFIEISALSSTCDENSDSSSFSHVATLTWEELPAATYKTNLLSSFNCSLKFFSVMKSNFSLELLASNTNWDNLALFSELFVVSWAGCLGHEIFLPNLNKDWPWPGESIHWVCK